MGTPDIGGALTGSMNEGDISVSGDLDDVGSFSGTGDDTFTITAQGTYGTATIDTSTGYWTYTLDNSDPAVIALDPGDSLVDVFTVNMYDADGLSDIDNVSITINGIVCFAGGTRIETPNGTREIETLVPGDLVTTETGIRRIRWIGGRDVTKPEREADPKLRPVRISKGALGGGLPLRDLLVSRQHRMLVRSKIVERMFGVHDVFVSAIKLVEIPGIYVDDTIQKITYYHMLFDAHETVLAEGTPSESLFTGPEALKSISREARAEIMSIFPHLAAHDYVPSPAHLIPKGKLQLQLVERHMKNNQPFVDGAGLH